MTTCRFCGKDKTDQTAPELGCWACEKVLMFIAKRWLSGVTPHREQRLCRCVDILLSWYPATKAAFLDIEDEAFSTARRIYQQEAAYRRFQIEGVW